MGVLFSPHYYCLAGVPFLVWGNVIFDMAIFLSYVGISSVLFGATVGMRRFPISSLFWMFGLFILFCGLTHLFGAVLMWSPWYYIDLGIKGACAVFSVGTCLELILRFDLVRRLMEVYANAERGE